MNTILRNKSTGELKAVKIGWSWTLFLFSGFLGLPLFLRKLNVWGGIFLALWIVNFFGGYIVPAEDAAGLGIVILLIFIGLGMFIGSKGNELTAKNMLENGWEFADPQSLATLAACGKWGLRP